MRYEFRLVVEVDEGMGFDSAEMVVDHIKETVRNAGDAGIDVRLEPVPEKSPAREP